MHELDPKATYKSSALDPDLWDQFTPHSAVQNYAPVDVINLDRQWAIFIACGSA